MIFRSLFLVTYVFNKRGRGRNIQRVCTRLCFDPAVVNLCLLRYIAASIHYGIVWLDKNVPTGFASWAFTCIKTYGLLNILRWGFNKMIPYVVNCFYMDCVFN